MLSFIRKAVDLIKGPRKPKRLEASYDAAKTTTENRRHWSNADDNPPAWANTPDVRAKLRMRARFETDNNPYCSGMVSTLATDTVGYVPPKLQVLTPDAAFNRYVEEEWEFWSTHILVNLPAKLRILDEGKRVEGEQFLAMSGDESVGMETNFALNVNVIGASRVSNWRMGIGTNAISSTGIYNDDGVHVDVNTGRAVGYDITSLADEIYWGSTTLTQSTAPVPARYVLHWYTPRRAGQFRGISELTPALPLFAMMRRFDLATLTAAETAAMLAGIMKTNAPLESGPASVRDWQYTELERGTLLTLPEGWDATQFKPENPTSNYEMFVNCILRQIGRSLDIPFGVVAGDSSRYNYSSARLDYTGYDERLKFDRQQLIIRVLDPLFKEWLLEFRKVDPRVNRQIKALGNRLPHDWQFTKRPSIDPEKDARTSTERITNGTSNLAIECAQDGTNWEEVLIQRAAELKKIKELGLTPGQASDILNNGGNSIQNPPTNTPTNEQVPANVA
jgi:lambda family phage portal protein